MEGIPPVLDVMRKAELTPTSVTYVAMMTAYAVSGQLAKMNGIITHMKLAKISLSQNQMTSVLLLLVKSEQAGKELENIDYVSSDVATIWMFYLH